MGEGIITDFCPRQYGKEYAAIKGPSQYPMFAAVAKGVKPLFDDWIPAGKYQEFVEVCRTYDLLVEPSVMFVHHDSGEEIVGKESLTTTAHEVLPFSLDEAEGDVHVLVGRSRAVLEEARRWCWYPVTVRKRLVNKPFVDHLRYGKSLGFPSCCVDGFRRHNNWHIYSHPRESLRQTPILDDRKRASLYCNHFLMDHTFFYVHHVPCSYRCAETERLGKRVEAALLEEEPGFVEKTNTLLRKPLLVFSEQDFVIFDKTESLVSEDGSGEIRYGRCEYVRNPARPQHQVDFEDALHQGNRISLDGNGLRILDGKDAVKTVSGNERWFLVDFDG